MRNIAFFGSTGPSFLSNLATRVTRSATRVSNSSRRTSYAGLFQTNQGRVLFCASPVRNSTSAGRCMGLEAACRFRGSAADVAHLDLRQRRGVLGADLGIAIAALQPDRRDGVGDSLVVAAVAQQRPEIEALSGEQAGVELALGGQSGPRAVAAEGLGPGGGDTDLSRIVATRVGVAPALGAFASVIRVDRLQRQFGTDDAQHFRRRHYVVHPPAVGVPDVHVFDEAQDVAAALEPTRHRQDLAL